MQRLCDALCCILLSSLFNSFPRLQDYVNLYTKTYKDEDGKPLSIVYEQCGQRWHVAAAASDKGFQHVSFVNRSAMRECAIFCHKRNSGGILVEFWRKYFLIIDSSTHMVRVAHRWNFGQHFPILVADKSFSALLQYHSIATTKGGRHVDHVTELLCKQLLETVKKKEKKGSNINIKPFQIKNHMWVFISCQIVNPTFDSQTKENMTLQASK